MTTTELRRRVKKAVDSVPPAKLRQMAEVAGLLPEVPEILTPEDRRRVKRMRRRLAESERELAAGKGVRWDDLRRKYA